MSLALANMVERHEALLIFLIHKRAMPLRERTARSILARKPDGIAFVEQSAEGERFAGRPVDAFTAFEHLRFRLKLARNGLVQVKTLGRGRQRMADFFQRLTPDGRLAATIALRRHGKARPAAVEPVGAIRAMRFRRF